MSGVWIGSLVSLKQVGILNALNPCGLNPEGDPKQITVFYQSIHLEDFVTMTLHLDLKEHCSNSLLTLGSNVH